jgi:hypothetical protein
MLGPHREGFPAELVANIIGLGNLGLSEEIAEILEGSL